jgi:hypothetical protein
MECKWSHVVVECIQLNKDFSFEVFLQSVCHEKKCIFNCSMATLLYTRTIPRTVRMFEMIDLMLSRKKIQKCHVVLEENLDDTGAY